MPFDHRTIEMLDDHELLRIAEYENRGSLSFVLGERLALALTLEDQLEQATGRTNDLEDSVKELNEEIDGLKQEVSLLQDELAEANELLSQQREKELANTCP